MSLYKMKFEFSRQSWYDSEGVYKLVEKHSDGNRHEYLFWQNMYLNLFRLKTNDCTWKNVLTGELINNWDHVMRPLTQLEIREFNLNLVTQDLN